MKFRGRFGRALANVKIFLGDFGFRRIAKSRFVTFEGVLNFEYRNIFKRSCLSNSRFVKFEGVLSSTREYENIYRGSWFSKNFEFEIYETCSHVGGS